MRHDWPLIEREDIGHFKVFHMVKDTRRHPTKGSLHHFYQLQSQDWVNVIPLTHDDEVVLVRQFRAGLSETTVEIPGGLVDPGESPVTAALRELREETGYEAEQAEELGWVHPNPALFDNRTYTYLARGARKAGEQKLDSGEAIEILTVPLAEIPAWIKEGKITHSLVISGFYRLFMERHVQV